MVNLAYNSKKKKDILQCFRLLLAKKLGLYDSPTYHFGMLVTLMLPLQESLFPISKYQLKFLFITN